MKIRTACLALSSLTLIPFAAQASDYDYNFYGSLRVMVEEAKHDNGDSFKDAVSRIGVNGSHDLGNGMQAFAKYELSVDVAEGELGSDTGKDARQAYIGLSGDYGSLMLGRYWSSFYNAVGYASDQLWVHSAPVYYTLDGGSRIGQSALYESPDLAGLKLKALVQIDDDDNGEEGQHQLGATYNIGNLTLGVAYTDAANDKDIYGLSASYSGNGFYINGAWMDREDTGSGFDALVGIQAGKNLFTVGLSSLDDDAGSDDFDALILAYQRNLHKDVLIWVEAMAWDGSLYGIDDSNVVHLGMNFNF